MSFLIDYSCVSNIGLRRRMNQDNFICNGAFASPEELSKYSFPISGTVTSEQNTLFGVFDGMGGEARGEMASYLAAKRAFYTVRGKSAEQALNDICLSANSDICEYIEEHCLTACGTTAAMLLFAQTGITACNIGDSKIFRLSDGKLEQLSQDHLSIAPYGEKPPLSQYLGIPPEEMYISPYYVSMKYCESDCYIICSDGLTDMVTPENIARSAAAGGADLAAQTLVDLALKAGGKDNITVIVLKIHKAKTGFRKFIERVIKGGNHDT